MYGKHNSCFVCVFAGCRDFDTPVSPRGGSDCLEVEVVTPWGQGDSLKGWSSLFEFCGGPYLAEVRAYSGPLLEDHSLKELRRPNRVQGNEPRSPVGKGSPFPAVLSL